MDTMVQLYACTYLATRPRQPPNANADACQFFHARNTPAGFPYDGGDDPSFFCAKHNRNAVTWGVCRPNVRCQILMGDWVAFFAGVPLGAGIQGWQYRFVALLQVESKVSGWQPPQPFDRYLNLLVAPPPRNGFPVNVIPAPGNHFEPALDRADWHTNWLWRLSARPPRQSQAFTIGNVQDTPPPNHRQQAAADGCNYIVFSQTVGFVLVRPPVVAKTAAVGAGYAEVWNSSTAALELRDLIFDANALRRLRCANRRNPHLHVRRDWQALATDIIRIKELCDWLSHQEFGE